MSTCLRALVASGLLALATVVLYGSRLSSSVSSAAEAAVRAEAASIATSGVDTHGRAWPVFFETGDARWMPPAVVYASALAHRALPESETAGRWASVVVAALDVALLFLVARRLAGGHVVFGVVAAATLLFTPAHAAFGRLAVDALYPVPFALGWLLFLLVFLDRGRAGALAAAGLCLGAGVYTHTAAPVTFGAYLVVTIGMVLASGRGTWRAAVGFAAGCVLPLVPMAAWFAARPETYPDTMGAWAIHAAHVRNPADLWRALVNWNTLGTRASLYWDAFNPVYLFLPGGPPPGGVVRGAGVFAVSMAPLVAIGLHTVWTRTTVPTRVLLLSATALAPLAASTFGERWAIDRAMVALPLLAILATYGGARLAESTRPAPLRALAALLALAVAQFFWFFRAL